MQNIIETQEDYQGSLATHKKLCFYTLIIFVASNVFGFIGAISVLYGLTRYDIINWLILIVCSVLFLISSMMFVVSAIQVRSLERNIINYSDKNNIKLRLKTVGLTILKSLIFFCFLVFISQFLTLAYFK